MIARRWSQIVLAAAAIAFVLATRAAIADEVSPLALVPVMALARPERASGAYLDSYTLMACSAARAPLPQ